MRRRIVPDNENDQSIGGIKPICLWLYLDNLGNYLNPHQQAALVCEEQADDLRNYRVIVSAHPYDRFSDCLTKTFMTRTRHFYGEVCILYYFDGGRTAATRMDPTISAGYESINAVTQGPSSKAFYIVFLPPRRSIT